MVNVHLKDPDNMELVNGNDLQVGLYSDLVTSRSFGWGCLKVIHLYISMSVDTRR